MNVFAIFEGSGRAHMGFSESLETIVNGTDMNLFTIFEGSGRAHAGFSESLETIVNGTEMNLFDLGFLVGFFVRGL